MTLAAAHAALDAGELLEQSTRRVRDARDRLYRGLEGVRGLRAFPSAANFVLIRCEAAPAADVFRRLVETTRDPRTRRLGRAGPRGLPCASRPGRWMTWTRSWAPHGDFLERVMSRLGEARRKTKETEVRVRLDLDGSGRADVKNRDRVLRPHARALARHALYDLDLGAAGDLHVDAHHTVEDVGIVLGQALAQALGERRGIRRYGAATVPLDDALARVVCGRERASLLGVPRRSPRGAELGLRRGPDTGFFRALRPRTASRCTWTCCAGKTASRRSGLKRRRARWARRRLDARVQGVPSTKGPLA